MDFKYRTRSLGAGTQAFVISTGCNVTIPDLLSNGTKNKGRTLNIERFKPGVNDTDTEGCEYPVTGPKPLVCCKGLPTSPTLTATAMRSTTILPLGCTSLLMHYFLIVGTALAAIVSGRFVGVAPQAQVNCIKVTKGDKGPLDPKDVADGIRLAVKLASNSTLHSVILAAPSGLANQEYDDAVRILTVSWNNT